jgi:transcription antitermination factor NusG
MGGYEAVRHDTLDWVRDAEARVNATRWARPAELGQAEPWSAETVRERQWYALSCAGNAERAAEARLVQVGVTAFLPMRAIDVKRCRHLPRSRANCRKIDVPLLPGYVFAGFRGAVPWADVLGLRLIHGVVGFCGEPVGIPHDWLEEAMRAKGVWKLAGRRPKPQLGDRVRLVEGVFAGHWATVRRLREYDAELLLELFGKRVRITEALDLLELAA